MSFVIGRRSLLRRSASLVAAATLSCAVTPRVATRIPVVGIFPRDPARMPTDTAAFVDGLRESGYEDGRNVRIEWRWAPDADIDSGVDDTSAQLVALPVDVLVAVGGPAQFASKRATTTIPIVIYAGTDPVEAGLVESVARTGGNITGVASVNALVDAKKLELLKEVAPNVSRVAVLSDDTATRQVRRRGVEVAARSLGLEVVAIEVHDVAELPRALEVATAQRADSLLVLAVSGMTTSTGAYLLEYLAVRRIPAVHVSTMWVDRGGLMNFGTSGMGNSRSAGRYVARILNGERPAEMAMEQPTKFELVINLKTAREHGIAIPQSVLSRATRVIE